MAWLMAMHIVSLLIWSAGLFYIPALCSSGVSDVDRVAMRRIRVHTRFVFIAVASPAAVLTIISGGVLIYATQASGEWFAAKLTLVALMAMFHGFCGHMLAQLGHEGRHHKRFNSLSVWTILAPVLLIPAVLWLVLAKPQLLS